MPHPNHPPGCPCPVCNQPQGRSTEVLTLRLPRDLAEWVRAQGAASCTAPSLWVRDLLALERRDQEKRAARLAELEASE